MKVFVATNEGQGLRKTDFFHSKEEDLVFFPFECGSDANHIDGSCGCRRSMEGLDSGSTTTFKVMDLNLSEEKYYKKFLESLVKVRRFDEIEMKEDLEYLKPEFQTLIDAANVFPCGLILEKRGNDIQPRPSVSFTVLNEE